MDILLQLKKILENNSMPHAVLFEGARRYEASKYYAKAVVCSGDIKPCLQCKNCKKADLNSHPDIIQYYPSGALKGYPIETIREIRADAFVSPNEANRKVYIINDVDNISEISQNALLKILEEPPKSAVFILNCLQKSHLLDTIISRVTVFSANGEEKIDDSVDNQHYEDAVNIINAAVFDTQIELLKKLNDLSADKNDRIAVMAEMKNYLRKLYLAKVSGTTNENVNNIVEKLTINNIISAVEAVENAESANFRKSNIRLYLTRLSAQLKKLLG